MRIVGILVGCAVLFGLVSCADANSGRERVSVLLQSVAGSGVSGTATLSATDGGTTVAVRVSGLIPSEDVLGVINAGRCGSEGASPLALPRLRSNSRGVAHAYGPLRFRGREDVALSDLADGEHVVRIIGRGEVACGVVPEP
jgi:hypothetical protein